MATIRSVADEAGVSVATVSRVLNNHRKVDEELAVRVREAVDRLGYRINPMGRALRRQRSPMWGFIASDIENSFFAGLLRGLEEVAFDHGRLVMLCNTDENLERESEYLKLIAEYRFSGLVLATASTGEAQLGATSDVPVVLVDRIAKTLPHTDSVLVHNELGALEAARHLVDRGYRAIGCIAGPEDVSTATQRLQGFQSGLNEAGLDLPDSLIERGDYRQSGGLEATRRLLSRHPKLDALFVSNAQMAVGTITALRQLSLRVAYDVGFVTFDDEGWTSLVEPQLTVVRQPVHDLGRVAGELLLEREGTPEGVFVETHRVLKPRLIVRDSTPGPRSLNNT